MPDIYKNAKATYILIIICLLAYYFLPREITYRLSLYAPAVRSGQWERLISAMFLHLNTEHLFSNMVSLFFAGTFLEAITGQADFFIIYLSSGIIGNILTYLADTISGREVYSLGASGAIAGLIGAVIAIIIVDKLCKKKLKLPAANILFASFIVCIPGLSEAGVNAIGHIGGFIGGLIVGGGIRYLRLRQTKS